MKINIKYLIAVMLITLFSLNSTAINNYKTTNISYNSNYNIVSKSIDKDFNYLIKPVVRANLLKDNHKLRSVAVQNINSNTNKISMITILRQRPIEIALFFSSCLFIMFITILYINNSKKKQIIMLLEKDSITGKDSYYKFKEQTRLILNKAKPYQYVMLRIDIDEFKLVNDKFGEEGGNRVLVFVSDAIKSLSNSYTIFSRMEADDFVVLLSQNSNSKEFFNQLTSQIEKYKEVKIAFHMGIYEIEDPAMSVSSICDRALLALQSVKNNNTDRVGKYTTSMYTNLMETKQLAQDFDSAIKNEEFEVLLQPQINYSNNTIIGTEALVRWNHPMKGLILPNVFIPIFEQNGTIAKLDYYVWEKSCQYITKWKQNSDVMPPIAVNISRITAQDPHLLDKLSCLVKSYNLTPDLLRVEITETAYVDNTNHLSVLVSNLKNAGFTVEMDDFGVGYSSLNTLKEIPVDALKLDMKFLSSTEKSDRGGNILCAIIRMARWLKLPTIAEGVETKEQADYLKSLGCIYMQGYYFDKPMSIDEFEVRYLKKSIGDMDCFSNVDVGGAAAFWDPSAQMALLFNSFVGGAAIIECTKEGDFELVRANDKFFLELGITREEYQSKDPIEHFSMSKQDFEKFVETIKKAVYTQQETMCEILNINLEDATKNTWLQHRFKLLATNQDTYLFYTAIDNINSRKLMEIELKDKTIALEISFAQTGRLISYFNVEDYSMHMPKAYSEKFNIPLISYGREACVAEVIERDKKKCIAALDSIINGAKDAVVIYQAQDIQGNYHWEQASFVTIFDENGKPDKAVVTIEDASLKQEYVAACLRRKLLVERTGVTTLDYDVLTDTLSYNTVTRSGKLIEDKIVNYKENLDYVSFDVHPEFRQKVLNVINSVINGKCNSSTEELMVNNNGDGYRWYSMDYIGIFDEYGNVYRIVGHALDIQNERDNDKFLKKLDDNNSQYEIDRYAHTIAEKAFLMLYKSTNIPETIQKILTVLGEEYDLSRVYIFEDSFDKKTTKNTFEWCADNIEPQINILQNVVYETDLDGKYHENFDKDGVFLCPDISLLPPGQKALLEAQGIFSMLQCSILEDGNFKGFIGFDECRTNRQWDEHQISTLLIVSRVIGSFISKLRHQEELDNVEDQKRNLFN